MDVTFLFLFVVVQLLRGARGHLPYEHINRRVHELQTVRPTVVLCLCGEQYREIKELLDQNFLQRLFHSSINEKFPEKAPVDPFMENCSICEVKQLNCSRNVNSLSGYECFIDSAAFEVTSDQRESGIKDDSGNTDKIYTVITKEKIEFPIDIVIPVGGLRNHSRERRLVHPDCSYPTTLETSELKCKIYPRKIQCIQTCAYGHTQPQGPSITRECSQDERQWQPSEFEECQPFVDCGVTLTSGGWAVCSTPTVTDRVRCRIRCEKYEDKSCTGNGIYACDDEMRWEPELPFCAQAGSGLELVSRPKKEK